MYSHTHMYLSSTDKVPVGPKSILLLFSRPSTHPTIFYDAKKNRKGRRSLSCSFQGGYWGRDGTPLGQRRDDVSVGPR